MIQTRQQALDLILSYDLDQLLHLQSIRKCELSFHEFFRQAWRWIEGEKEYIDGWHIGAIAEHLEAVQNRQIKRLIINMPPRFAKSSMVSVSFPAWVWGPRYCPNEQFVFASHALSLSMRDSGRCRRLIMSPWYQERWGDRFKLLDDQNTKSRFDNNMRGHRISTSVGSGVTGEGGSMLIGDDLNDVMDANSDAMRHSVLDWLTQVWSTRLNDSKTGCRIIIQQRSHEMDVTGHILDSEDGKDWVRLVLPNEFEVNRRTFTVALPSTNGEPWTDPRTEEGSLLWPEKCDEAATAKLKATMSASDYAGQYQQRPSPEAGGILKKAWFQWWKDANLPQIDFIVQSWDTAFSTGAKSSYSACTTWGVFRDQNYIENVILLSMWRGRVEYVELRERAKRLYYDYTDTAKYSVKYPYEFRGRPIDLCLVEAKGSGDPLIRDLIFGGIKPLAVVPKSGKDKVFRAQLVSHLIESGRVWVPARPPHYETLQPYADEFVELAAAFPNLESNDVIDTATQALNYLKNGMFLYNPKDGRPEQLPHRKDVKVY